MEKPLNNLPSYRFEYKFVISAQDLQKFIYNPVFLNHFILHYPPRWINNLYFDDFKYTSYWENMEGLSERKKYRMRWYGDLFSQIKITAEQKIKADNVNYKKILKLGTFLFNDFTQIKQLQQATTSVFVALQNIDFNIFSVLLPTLLNRYHRTYYVTKDHKTRLTIDKNLIGYNVNLGTKRISTNVIVEIKSDSFNPIFEDIIPLQLGKSSKYVMGIM